MTPMRTRTSIIFALLCLVAVLVVGYLYLWNDPDETVINRNLDELVALAEKSGEEAPFYTLSQSREMLKFIAATPEIHFGPPLPVLDDRNELGAAIAQVRQTAGTLSIRITDRVLTVAEDRQSAEMEIEAVANVSYGGEAGNDKRRFSLRWIQEDDKWVIQKVTLINREELPAFDLPL